MKSEKLQHWLSGEMEQHPVGCRAVATAKHPISTSQIDSDRQ